MGFWSHWDARNQRTADFLRDTDGAAAVRRDTAGWFGLLLLAWWVIMVLEWTILDGRTTAVPRTLLLGAGVVIAIRHVRNRRRLRRSWNAAHPPAT